jgi:hypothetical protein
MFRRFKTLLDKINEEIGVFCPAGISQQLLSNWVLRGYLDLLEFENFKMFI